MVVGPVPLGAKFENKKTAASHCVKVAEEINLAAFDLNNIYIETFTIYRRLIFHLKNAKEIKTLLNNFEFNFNRLFVVTANYEYFIFLNLEKCKKALQEALALLVLSSKQKFDYYLVNEIKTLQKRLIALVW